MNCVRIGLALCFGVLGAVAGCASSPGSQDAKEGASGAKPDAPLVNTYWKLVELNGAPAVLPKGPDKVEGREAHIILQTEDGRFVGSTGVNRTMGVYKLDGANLTLTQGPTTLMAGPPDLMKQEMEFAKALGSVTTYKIRGESLTLFNGDKPVAKFQAVWLK